MDAAIHQFLIDLLVGNVSRDDVQCVTLFGTLPMYLITPKNNSVDTFDLAWNVATALDDADELNETSGVTSCAIQMASPNTIIVHLNYISKNTLALDSVIVGSLKKPSPANSRTLFVHPLPEELQPIPINERLRKDFTDNYCIATYALARALCNHFNVSRVCDLGVTMRLIAEVAEHECLYGYRHPERVVDPAYRLMRDGKDLLDLWNRCENHVKAQQQPSAEEADLPKNKHNKLHEAPTTLTEEANDELFEIFLLKNVKRQKASPTTSEE